MGYSGIQCCSVEMYSGVQRGTVEVSEMYSEVQSMYSGCQTMSVNFWEHQWILNSVVKMGLKPFKPKLFKVSTVVQEEYELDKSATGKIETKYQYR